MTEDHRPHILVADDNRDAADSLVILLEVTGFKATAAYDGEEAVAQSRRLHPDAIILDINMPVMDGYQAARTIRSTRREDRVLLIALTGRCAPEDIRAADAAGFDAHLVKPVAGDELVELLRAAIVKHGNRPVGE